MLHIPISKIHLSFQTILFFLLSWYLALLSIFIVCQKSQIQIESFPFPHVQTGDQGRFIQYIALSFHFVYSISFCNTLCITSTYYFPYTPDEELLRQRFVSLENVEWVNEYEINWNKGRWCNDIQTEKWWNTFRLENLCETVLKFS